MIKTTGKILIILTLILIALFLSHAILFHDHPKEIFGEGMQAAMHGSDRKLLAILIVFIVIVNITKPVLNALNVLIIKLIDAINSNFSHKIFNRIFLALKKGVIHTKVF